jgi:hypothetical protein
MPYHDQCTSEPCTCTCTCTCLLHGTQMHVRTYDVRASVLAYHEGIHACNMDSGRLRFCACATIRIARQRRRTPRTEKTEAARPRRLNLKGECQYTGISAWHAHHERCMHACACLHMHRFSGDISVQNSTGSTYLFKNVKSRQSALAA